MREQGVSCSQGGTNMLRHITVGENERALVTRKRRFAEVLGPGDHWIFGSDIAVEAHNTRELVYQGDWASYIVNLKPEVAAEYFTVVETNERQVALVYL